MRVPGDEMTETLFRTAAEAARSVARKQIWARELTELMLARIDSIIRS